jgi:sec-independent protein translocase protein TatC
MSEEKQLNFLGHLRELRSCILRSVIAVFIAFIISYFLADRVFEILRQPVPGLHLIYTEITEMLGTYLKVMLYISMAIAFPYIVYQTVMFINPALNKRERIYVYVLLPATLILFVGGVLFAYFILLPPALNFLFTFGNNIAEPMIRVDSYISVLVRLLFWIGMCFEIPLVIFFFSRIGIVKTRQLNRFRPWAYVFAFVLGGLITPTLDPVNQTLVAVPIIVLYEVGVLLSRIARPKKDLSASVP